MKKIVILFLVILNFLCASFLYAEEEAYTPNPKSIEFNEKGVAISNKDPELAEQFFQKALSEDNKNISALLNYATLKISQKKQDAIVNLLEDYTKKFPAISDIHYLLGDVYFANKDIDKALGEYKKVLILKPKTPGLFAKVGNIYMLKKNLSNAEFMYEQAANETPNDAIILLNYANVLIANKNLDKALEITKKALSTKDDPEAYYTLATIYEMKDDASLALEYYKKAKEKGSKREDISEKINSLNNAMEAF